MTRNAKYTVINYYDELSFLEYGNIATFVKTKRTSYKTHLLFIQSLSKRITSNTIQCQ